MLSAPSAGKPADEAMLVNVPRLVTAYYSDRPEPSVPSQRVVFGTSGHRGSAFAKSFNEWHILAGGLKVVTKTGWFAARPSGTENIYKIYAESFQDGEHLRRIVDEAQSIVSGALAAAPISGTDKVSLSLGLPAAVQISTGENT